MDAGGLKERPHLGRVSERGWVFWKGIGTRVGFLEGARKRVASKAGGKQKTSLLDHFWAQLDCFLGSVSPISKVC